MVDILDVMKSWTDNNGEICAKLALQVSTRDELPKIGDAVGGMKVQAGSFAQLIQESTLVTLDDDTDSGTWYPEA